LICVAVLDGSNYHVLASGNQNPFGISDANRIDPSMQLVRNKAEKGWISKPDLDASFSDFSLPD